MPHNLLELDKRGLWRVHGTADFQADAIRYCAAYEEPGKDYVLVEPSPLVYDLLVEAARRDHRKTGHGLEVGPGFKQAIDELRAKYTQISRARVAIDPLQDFPTLYKHQNSNVTFLETIGGRGFVWDGTGSGKTRLAAIAAWRWAGPQGRVLVVCPKKARLWWQDEMQAVLPKGWEYVVSDDSLLTKERRIKALLADPDWSGVIILNWESLYKMGYTLWGTKQDSLAGLRDKPPIWDVCIADEMHRAKDRTTLQARAIYRISFVSRHFIGLTATPTDGRPDHLWAQLRCLDDVRFGAYHRWFSMFCDTRQDVHGYAHVRGPKNQEVLASVLERYAIMHQPHEYTDIPPVRFQRLKVDMSEQQAALYKQMKLEAAVQLNDGTALTASSVLAKTTRLRQISVDPDLLGIKCDAAKVDALLEYIADADKATNIVVFTSFRSRLDDTQWITDLAKRIELIRPCELLVGGMATARVKALTDWLDTNQGLCLLATTNMGGDSLNLQGASIQIFLDAPWSSIARRQALGRCARPGQRSDYVLIVDLVADGTLDAYVLDKLEAKLAVDSNLLTQPDDIAILAAERIMEEYRDKQRQFTRVL